LFFGSKTIAGSHTLNNVEFRSVGQTAFTIIATDILTVTNTLTFDGISNFVLNGGTIDVKGDIIIINTGFNGGSAVIAINGTGNQILQGNGIEGTGRLPNVIVNKPTGDVTVNSTVTIKGLLTFVNGKMITSNANLLVMTRSATVTDASSNSFVQGPVKKIGNFPFTFPVGKGNNFQPISISAPAGFTDAFTAEYFSTQQSFGSALDTGLGSISTCEYWVLDRNAGTSTVNVTLGWNANSCGVTQPPDMRVAGWDGTNWLNHGNGGITGDSITGTVVSSGAVNTFGPFTLGNVSILVFTVNDINLGSAASFALLAGGDIIANDSIYGTGNVGAIGSISSNIKATDTLFPSNDAKVQQALVDLNNAINIIDDIPGTALSGNLNGQTLSEGVYEIAGAATLTDTLTLTGDTSSIYVFKISDSLTVDTAVALYFGNVLPQNVYWRVRKTVTIKEDTSFKGIILCDSTISIKRSVNGKLAILSSGNMLIGNSSIFTSQVVMKTLVPPVCTCVPDVCNLLDNGDFNEFVGQVNVNLIDAFYIPSAHICCWLHTHGSPQVGAFQPHSSPFYAKMWSAYSPSLDAILGEGIQTGASITLGVTYELKFFIRSDPIPGVSTDNVKIALTKFPLVYSGQVEPDPLFKQEIYSENNFSSSSWAPRTVTFTADDNYLIIYFYPLQNGQNSVTWLNIDDITITIAPPIIDAGQDVTICEGESIQLNSTVTGGVPPYIYQWTPSASLNDNNIADPTATPNQTTTYQLDVLDASGCTGPVTDFVTVTVHPAPVVILGPNLEFCFVANHQFNISPSAGTPPFTYQWSPAAGLSCTNCPDPFLSTTAPFTEYTLTVTDDNNCTSENNINITVFPGPPTADFTFSIFGNCMNNPVNFNSLSPAAATFEWNFGDGSAPLITSSSSASHTYSQPGFYQVSLTATNACGCDVSTAIIYIIPSTNTYNQNCCSETQVSYDINDFTINSAADAADFQTLLANNTPLIMRGTLRIAPGQSLTIDTKFIEFGPQGEIIVERGATLETIAANLTGLSQCNTMWQGIEVWGNSSKTHFPVDLQFQGKIVTIRGAINMSHKGVLLGRTRLCFPQPLPCCINPPCPPPPLPLKKCLNSAYFPGFAGGIIQTLNTSFIQNAVSIKFTPTKTFNNASNIDGGVLGGGEFNGGVLPDPGYKSQFGPYDYPNIRNPFYPHATITGRPPYHIYNWGAFDVNYEDYPFKNADIGIKSYDATNIVERNLFFNLEFGFRAYHTINSLFSAQIVDDNRFVDITSLGITYWGGNYAIISDNIFENDFANQQQDFLEGIDIKNSSGFRITDNVFTNLFNGIIVVNSGNSGGFIGPEDVIDGNVFTQCKRGIFAWEQNPRLPNTFNNPSISKYSGDWITHDLLADQGVFDLADPFNDKNPAGNSFDPNPTVPSKPLRSIDHTGCPYTYFRHDFSQICDQCVTPDPFGAAFVFNTGAVKTSNSCDQSIGDPCAGGLIDCRIAIDSLQDEIDTLEDERNAVANNLDQ